MHFVVSMETTSRQNRYLQVWYGDGHSNTVSLEDTESPKLVLLGNGKEMEIVASYGEGCNLTVEFQYIYEIEGAFNAKAEVYESIEGICNKHDIEETEENLEDQGARYLDPDLFSFEYSEWEEESQEENCRKKNIEAELHRDILVLQEIKGVKIHSARMGKCDSMFTIQAEVLSRVNISFHWTIHRITEDGTELNEPDRDDDIFFNLFNDELETEKELPVDTSNDLELIVEKDTLEPGLNIHFDKYGMYVVTVTVENALSKAEGSTNFVIQCPILGLYASCSELTIPTNSYLDCEATIDEGSDVNFQWFIVVKSEKSVERIEKVNYDNFEGSSILQYKVTKPRNFELAVIAQNNVSDKIFSNLAISVQEPVKNAKVLKNSDTLLGNETPFAIIYLYPRNGQSVSLYNQLQFGYDFGNGFQWTEHGCRDENEFCYAQTRHTFETAGKHNVQVFVSNDVSEYTETVEVWVLRGLEEVTAEVVGKAVAGQPTRFIVLEDGKLTVNVVVHSFIMAEVPLIPIAVCCLVIVFLLLPEIYLLLLDFSLTVWQCYLWKFQMIFFFIKIMMQDLGVMLLEIFY